MDEGSDPVATESMSNITGTMEERIETPSINDVLCGRGGSINSHKGNEQFRELVEKRKRVYLTARFKREKRLIAASIVTEIREMNPPGRFLARKGDKDNGYWYDIGDEKARDKSSQALRENAPSLRAEIEMAINEQREEMKRKEHEETTQHPSPPFGVVHHAHPFYQQGHPPPPHHPSYQAYWDWYHHYYGYAQSGHHPGHYPLPPPHVAAVPPPPMLVPSHNPAHGQLPQTSFWGHVAVPAPANQHNSNGEEYKDNDDVSHLLSQEEEDHKLALELQQEEKAALYEARKERYKSTLAKRSNAYLGADPRISVSKPRTSTTSHVRRQPPSEYHAMENGGMSQEQQDHRLAMALQNKEDIVRKKQIKATCESSLKSSRSSAYPHFGFANSTSNDPSPSLGSFMAWMTSDGDPKPSSRRTVQWKEDNLTRARVKNGPSSLQRQSSIASADRPLQPQAEQNASLLSQVANHIIGWDSNSISPRAAFSHGDLSGRSHFEDEEMETEGLEVQLRDPNEDAPVPAPDPRVQIDWSSKSHNSWIPESMNTGWNQGHSLTSVSGHQMGISMNSLSGHMRAISPMNSIDMDTSANAHSIGGGSFSQMFEQDESFQQAIRKVPSWERSARSKSPLSFTSVDNPETSVIRVRELKLFRPAGHSKTRNGAGGVDMDWEG